MGTHNHLWSIAKRSVSGALIGVTISDRYVTVVSVTGDSMLPTFTASNSALQGIVVSISTDQQGMDSWMILQSISKDCFIFLVLICADQVARTR